MQDVFEPTANFAGEVFEPMNFDGDYSNFAVLNCGCVAKHPINKGKRKECINQCNQKKSDKKGGGANVTDISSLTPASTPVPTPAPASTPVPATAMETTPDNNSPQEKFLGMPKKVGIGVAIGVGVLVIGLTTFFLLRRK